MKRKMIKKYLVIVDSETRITEAYTKLEAANNVLSADDTYKAIQVFVA